ncbi:antibiotic biosynthesis monooxygenase [Streptomyces sp. NPDC056982]|uniref:antibiotic biosynthesis monooxygenase n=1 Tax=Streptomyces sp. NPDC056982 TaxID=3345986 RepID=UPI00363C319F
MSPPPSRTWSKPGRHDAYEEWLRQVIPAAAAYDGHQGVNVLRPAHGGHHYTVALRFDSADHLIAWLEYGTRARLMEAVSHLLAEAESVDVHCGLDSVAIEPIAVVEGMGAFYDDTVRELEHDDVAEGFRVVGGVVVPHLLPPATGTDLRLADDAVLDEGRGPTA